MDATVREFVERSRVARLATSTGRGVPHVVPVCFVLTGDDVLIALDEKPKRVAPQRLRRVRNIIENPRAQLLVDRYDEDWTRLAFAQLNGVATVLEAGPEHEAAVISLRSKYPQYRAMSLESRPIIRIRVEGVVSWGDLTGGGGAV